MKSNKKQPRQPKPALAVVLLGMLSRSPIAAASLALVLIALGRSAFSSGVWELALLWLGGLIASALCCLYLVKACVDVLRSISGNTDRQTDAVDRVINLYFTTFNSRVGEEIEPIETQKLLPRQVLRLPEPEEEVETIPEVTLLQAGATVASRTWLIDGVTTKEEAFRDALRKAKERKSKSLNRLQLIEQAINSQLDAAEASGAEVVRKPRTTKGGELR